MGELEDPRVWWTMSDGVSRAPIFNSDVSGFCGGETKKKRKEKRDAELKIDAVVGVVHSQSESHSRGIVQQNKQQLLQFICHVSSIDWAVWLRCFIHKSTHVVFSLRFVLTNYC